MRVRICIFVCLWLVSSDSYAAKRSPDASKISFEITRFSRESGLLHWKLTNGSDDGVFVYNFFLLGGAYNVERTSGKLVFDTCPIVRVASCPPNRVAPVLFLFVRSGGVIEGDFVDDEVRRSGGNEVSLKIAVGSDPDAVAEEAERFYKSDCKHSPYDAIVNWATYLESTRVRVP
jgi:hypothetical protein